MIRNSHCIHRINCAVGYCILVVFFSIWRHYKCFCLLNATDDKINYFYLIIIMLMLKLILSKMHYSISIILIVTFLSLASVLHLDSLYILLIGLMFITFSQYILQYTMTTLYCILYEIYPYFSGILYWLFRISPNGYNSNYESSEGLLILRSRAGILAKNNTYLLVFSIIFLLLMNTFFTIYSDRTYSVVLSGVLCSVFLYQIKNIYFYRYLLLFNHVSLFRSANGYLLAKFSYGLSYICYYTGLVGLFILGCDSVVTSSLLGTIYLNRLVFMYHLIKCSNIDQTSQTL